MSRYIYAKGAVDSFSPGEFHGPLSLPASFFQGRSLLFTQGLHWIWNSERVYKELATVVIANYVSGVARTGNVCSEGRSFSF